MSDRESATRKIVELTGGRVESGPFQGMIVDPHRVSWGDGDVGSRLLGCYEAELHPVIQEILDADFQEFINVGCAEGYYAVGVAMSRPTVRVTAVDISQAARTHTLAHAELNDCVVHTRSDLPKASPGQVWMVDVEGAEVEVLDPERDPGLRHCSILVELHDWVHDDLVSLMVERFAFTHEIELFGSGPRDPHEFDIMVNMPDREKWAVMSEGRPQSMRWLWMTPIDWDRA